MFEGAAHHGGKAWRQESEAAGHVVSIVSKHRDEHRCWLPRSFLFSLGFQPMAGATHTRGSSFYLSKPNLETPSERTLVVLNCTELTSSINHHIPLGPGCWEAQRKGFSKHEAGQARDRVEVPPQFFWARRQRAAMYKPH